MRSRHLILGAAIAVLLQQPAPARAQDVRFASAALGREMPYRVLLPDTYETSKQRRYPVLYLLHGLDGHYDNWTSRTKLAQHLAGRNLIVVTPEGGNSWYLNWHEGDRERWEDYVVRDLIADVDARFRTDARRESRFIAGLSMGGYGALRLALKHPGRFAFAGSLSGAFNITRLETYGWTEALRDEHRRAFGPMGSERRAQEDLFTLAKNAAPAGLPFLYVDCGADDLFLPGNRELAAILQEKKIAYEYRETPGTHNWAYWDRQVVGILDAIDAIGR